MFFKWLMVTLKWSHRWISVCVCVKISWELTVFHCWMMSLKDLEHSPGMTEVTKERERFPCSSLPWDYGHSISMSKAWHKQLGLNNDIYDRKNLDSNLRSSIQLTRLHFTKINVCVMYPQGEISEDSLKWVPLTEWKHRQARDLRYTKFELIVEFFTFS